MNFGKYLLFIVLIFLVFSACSDIDNSSEDVPDETAYKSKIELKDVTLRWTQ